MARTVTTTITNTATRTGATLYGNPIYVLHTEDGDYRISDDASANYAATNFRAGDRVQLDLTRAGRVEGLYRR